ncbi:hypothetical protein ABT120_19670 [Nonomuraea angiospora]|uniref:hypothetical protein n=1 Tax=Nonomuraea angiospora TaxID=46172 RepID=UPI0033250D8F
MTKRATVNLQVAAVVAVCPVRTFIRLEVRWTTPKKRRRSSRGGYGSGSFTGDGGHAEHSAARDGLQLRSQDAHELTQLAFHLVDARRQLAAAFQQLTSDLGDDSWHVRQALGELVLQALTAQAAKEDAQLGIEFVQVPA